MIESLTQLNPQPHCPSALQVVPSPASGRLMHAPVEVPFVEPPPLPAPAVPPEAEPPVGWVVPVPWLSPVTSVLPQASKEQDARKPERTIDRG